MSKSCLQTIVLRFETLKVPSLCGQLSATRKLKATKMASSDISIRGASGLSQERKTSIENALQKYRRRVLELNMNALEYIVQDIEQQSPPSPSECPADRLPALCIAQLKKEHGIVLKDHTVTSIRDFLSEARRQALIEENQLDGVIHGGPVNLASRRAWIDDIEQKITTYENARARPSSLPADLKYLMTLVRGMCGPGLPNHRFYDQLPFIADLDGEDAEEIGTIAVPPAQEEHDSDEFSLFLEVWGDDEVAIGVSIATGAGGIAVYCREEGNDDAEWVWKYGLIDPPTQSDLYDTIEDFLDFYAERNKQSKEEGNVDTRPADVVKLVNSGFRP